jgi:hypothetical protein
LVGRGILLRTSWPYTSAKTAKLSGCFVH